MSKWLKEMRIQYNKFDTEKFIKKSIQIWKNKYDYSKTEYIDSKTKVIIICKEHGEFEQLPSNHYKYGCGSCGHKKNVRAIEIKEKCKNNFEIKSNNIHNNVYSYTKTNYIDACTKVIVICKEHGEFSTAPNNHLRGKGCPGCGKELNRISKIKPYKDYYDEFLKLYDNKYDYSLVNWKGSSYPISILCK